MYFDCDSTYFEISGMWRWRYCVYVTRPIPVQVWCPINTVGQGRKERSSSECGIQCCDYVLQTRTEKYRATSLSMLFGIYDWKTLLDGVCLVRGVLFDAFPCYTRCTCPFRLLAGCSNVLGVVSTSTVCGRILSNSPLSTPKDSLVSSAAPLLLRGQVGFQAGQRNCRRSFK